MTKACPVVPDEAQDKPHGRMWTLEAWAIHTESIREMDRRLEAERDRRYSEVNTEREKALKIKETADLAALSLAREIQTYKDEKANMLREQIDRERVTYATKGDLMVVVDKFEAAMKPVAEFVLTQVGRDRGLGLSANVIAFVVPLSMSLAGLVVYLLS